MKKKSGFTMIEVVLVLAIAGLIFLATFIALPNLWASQRDSARKENIMAFVTNLKNYQTNNSRGALPGTVRARDNCTAYEATGGSPADVEQTVIDKGGIVRVDGECATQDRHDRLEQMSEQTWSGFYRDYMTDAWDDPGGHPYDLYVARCEYTTLATGAECDNGHFKELWGIDNVNKSNWVDNTLYIAVGATCDGDTAVKSLNSRKVAVVYKLERTGQFCYSS